MNEFFNAVSAVVVLLMLMAVGYLMGRFGWMDGHVKGFLGRYIMNIAVPCNCLVGVLNNLDRDALGHAGWMLLCAALGIGCALLTSMALATLLRLPRNRWGVFVAMGGLSNTLFIGLPLSTQIFGEVCVPYVMVYYLASTVFTQSVGVLLVERAGTVETGNTPGRFLRSVFTKPPILTVLGTVCLLWAGLRPPEVVMSFAKYISGSVSPLALIYCGFILYELGLRNMRLERGLPTVLCMRLILAPLICAGMCRLFGVSGLEGRVFIVESALPVVSQVTVMAGTFGADDRYAASGATLTTLGCFMTIPVLMLLLG